MNDADAPMGAYVDAAAALLDFSFDAERHSAVTAVVARLAAFAGDIAGLPLSETVEIAREWTP